MANLDVLRQQIDSAEDMQSIVRVMKTLSAVSIQKFQHAARRLRLYREVINRGLQAAMMTGAFDIQPAPDASPRTGLIVFGSDRGLCGRFNEIVVAHARDWLRQQPPGVPILALGERCAARLEADGLPPLATFSQPGTVEGLSRAAGSILLTLDRWRSSRGIERIMAVFNAEGMKGGAEPHTETILPLDREELAAIAERPWPSNQWPGFDGAPGVVFSMLLRERIYTSLMRVGAESLAAEHATRLSAMQGAERNITERLEELQGNYRRERQDAITTELMDIVSAYESMAGQDED
jgi:F-type H+-transporting ATPase subunit gamma